MTIKNTLAFMAPLATSVLGHGTAPYFRTDGKVNTGFLSSYYWDDQAGNPYPDTAGWYSANPNNEYIAPSAYGSSDINCHFNSRPGKATASIPAGGVIDFLWTPWPHIGPVFTYIAKCSGDCANADKNSLSWVKIDEEGIDIPTQKWAATKLIENNNTWTTTVPENLAPGNYVFRNEIIGVHSAGEPNGAQNYPQCFNIEVTGSGTVQLPAGTPGTQLYRANDPGILFNPYGHVDSYEIPGPKLWTGASASAKDRRHPREFS
ncbi:hypothetical protein ACO1O0_007938 [Amphichorda felina]